jgi:hypothetical protein
MKPDEDDLKRHHKATVWTGGCIAASLLVYFGIVEVIRMRLAPFYGFASINDTQTLRFVFAGGAVLSLILLRILQPVFQKSVHNALPDEIPAKLARTSKNSLFLAEIPALLGLILFLLTGMNRDFYAFLVVSLILIFMYFPRLSSWRDIAARA